MFGEGTSYQSGLGQFRRSLGDVLCSMPVVPGVEKPRVLELNKEERAQLELAWAAHLHVYYPLGPRHKQPTSRLCQLMKAMVIEHRTSLRDLQDRNNMQLKLIFERYGFKINHFPH
jgi:hypothetical protein